MIRTSQVKGVTYTNNSGGQLVSGDVVILDSTQDNSVTTTTTANDPKILGIVNATIEDGAAGNVCILGIATGAAGLPHIHITGSVSRGDFLSASTVAKCAYSTGTVKTEGTFAIALADGAAGAVVGQFVSRGGFSKTMLIGTVPHKQLWIGNIRPTTTSGCGGATSIEMGTNKNMYDYCPFDKDSIEYGYANVAMPQDYTGGVIYAQFYWLHPATTTNFKVSWGIAAVSFSNDDTLDAAQGTAIYSNDEGGTTSDLYISPQTAAITIAGTPVAGDLVQFRMLRKADDGTNDTLAVDAYLLGALIWYPVA